jgi:hypothetical protein
VREREQAEIWNPEFAGSFDYRTDRILTAAMPFVATEPAALRPSPVTIHHDGDVTRQSLAIERQIWKFVGW